MSHNLSVKSTKKPFPKFVYVYMLEYLRAHYMLFRSYQQFFRLTKEVCKCVQYHILCITILLICYGLLCPRKNINITYTKKCWLFIQAHRPFAPYYLGSHKSCLYRCNEGRDLYLTSHRHRTDICSSVTNDFWLP